jgi:hypothetical protein
LGSDASNLSAIDALSSSSISGHLIRGDRNLRIII